MFYVSEDDEQTRLDANIRVTHAVLWSASNPDARSPLRPTQLRFDDSGISAGSPSGLGAIDFDGIKLYSPTRDSLALSSTKSVVSTPLSRRQTCSSAATSVDSPMDVDDSCGSTNCLTPSDSGYGDSLLVDNENTLPTSFASMHNSTCNNIVPATQLLLGRELLARKRTFHHVESESCDSWKRPRADTMHRWYSCTAIDDCQVTADGQRRCGLPLSKCRHKVRHTITHETLAELLVGNRHALRPIDKIVIVDCRYPYEYEHGHIRGAVNAWNTDQIEQLLFEHIPSSRGSQLPQDTNTVVIFYCEFSSQRAPELYHATRGADRSRVGAEFYPLVHYPEMYLLEGGYKQFFADYPSLCEPQHYMPMDSDDFKKQRLQCEAVRRSGSTLSLKNSIRRSSNAAVQMRRACSARGSLFKDLSA